MWIVLVSIIGVILLIIGFFIISKRSEDRKTIEELNRQFGAVPLNRIHEINNIKIYFEEMKEDSEEYFIDEITWADLDMDQVFCRINNTKSFVGEQVLYNTLHYTNAKHQTAFEERQNFFKDNSQKRLDMECKLRNMGKAEHNYFLPVFLKNADSLEINGSYIYHILQALLFGNALVGIVFQNYVFLAVAILVALVNIAIYTGSKYKYEVFLSSLGSVRAIVLFAERILMDDELRNLYSTPELRKAVGELQGVKHLVTIFQMNNNMQSRGDISVIRNYLIGATLLDFTTFNSLTRRISGKLEQLTDLYILIGQLDIDISTVSFRNSLPFYCVPRIIEEERITTKMLYHPLIPDAVCNDLSIDRGCVITGENASGKSTFMKTIGVNVVMAQSIFTCTAKEMILAPLLPMTSMNLKDNLCASESYYVRELKNIKRVIDSFENGIQILFVCDELLRGTNSNDRLRISEAVLQHFAECRCMTVVATHDIELAERLKEILPCYYFRSEEKALSIFFDYKIHKGIASKGNAVGLLKEMGFPRQILCRLVI